MSYVERHQAVVRTLLTHGVEPTVGMVRDLLAATGSEAEAVPPWWMAMVIASAGGAA